MSEENKAPEEQQTPKALAAIQKKQLEDLCLYLRDLLKTKPKDFVLFRLDEIAKETEMPDFLKASFVKALDKPEATFTVNFVPNEPDALNK